MAEKKSCLQTVFILSIIVSRAAVLADKHQINVVSPLQNVTEHGNIIFSEKNSFKMTAGELKMITWSSNIADVKKVNVFVDDEFVSVITDRKEIFFPNHSSFNEYHIILTDEQTSDDITVFGFLNMTGKFVGYNTIHVELYGKHDQLIGEGTLEIAILLKELFITQVYFICLTVISMIIFTNMGANLNLLLIKDILKKPIGPAIGMFCQYGCMPLIAFGLGLIIFPDNQLYRLGLFASGCSPGGGMSNIWTHLLDGSLDLSVMMTFASTVVALGAVPLWLLTLGAVIVNANFIIPYKDVILGIFLLVIPCFGGILIQLKFPRLTKIMHQIITPLSLFNVFFILSFGIYANFYLFSLITWRAMVAGIGQSLCGHIAGIVFAVLCRRNWQEIIAISIETAIQNNGVAFVLLKLSLESPAGDLAVVMPACAVLATSMPLLCALLIKTIYKKCLKEVKSDNSEEPNGATTGIVNMNFSTQEICEKTDKLDRRGNANLALEGS